MYVSSSFADINKETADGKHKGIPHSSLSSEVAFPMLYRSSGSCKFQYSLTHAQGCNLVPLVSEVSSFSCKSSPYVADHQIDPGPADHLSFHSGRLPSHCVDAHEVRSKIFLGVGGSRTSFTQTLVYTLKRYEER